MIILIERASHAALIDNAIVRQPEGTHPTGRLSCKPRFEQWAAGHPGARLVFASRWRRLYPEDFLKATSLLRPTRESWA